MTPQERQEFNQMKSDIENIKRVSDKSFMAELSRRLASGTIKVEDGASTTGTTIAVRHSSGTGTELVAEDYAGVATLYVNGTLLGRIGYY